MNYVCTICNRPLTKETVREHNGLCYAVRELQEPFKRIDQNTKK